jgi:AcrR family transcriptional regulator
VSSPPTALIRAFGAEPQPERRPTATRILDATLHEAAATGLRRLAVEDVARRAGVSRVTVYRHFGDREQLIEAMAVRETRAFIELMRDAVSKPDGIEEQGVELFVVGLRFMHAHPVARRAIESEPEAIVQYLAADDGLLFGMGREFIADWLRRAQVRTADFEAAAETVLRLFVSFLVLPRSVVPLSDDAAARAYVRTCVTPAVSSPPTRRRRRSTSP